VALVRKTSGGYDTTLALLLYAYRRGWSRRACVTLVELSSAWFGEIRNPQTRY